MLTQNLIPCKLTTKYATMTYALVPLPEKDFTGTDRITVSDVEITYAVQRGHKADER